MSSQAKIILRKKANKAGLFPLAIRISKNRQSSYHYIGQYIELRFWDQNNNRVKKSHPQADKLNNLLIKKMSEVSEKLIDLQSGNNDISSKQIKNKIYSPLQSGSFLEISQDFLNELENNNKISRYASDKVRVKHFRDFVKSDKITFKEIDENLLRNFITYLKAEKSLSERSIVNNLVVIRTLYNRAIKLGLADSKQYPFGAKKIRIKFPETEKVGLNIPEIQKIESLQNLSENEIHARNVWLFSFYLAGMRIADVLKICWNDIYEGRIHYRMNKNSKLLSLQLPDKILPIIDFYINDKQHEKDMVFPEMKMADLKDAKDIFVKTNSATRKLNKYLEKVAIKAGISKKLTMHIARHSFGNISGDRIPIQMLQKLYRHSSITTTMMYQSNFMNKETDKALNSVVDF
jgi:integrase